MQKQKTTRTGRTLGALACLGIGGVFWWIFWMESRSGVGFLIFSISAAVALYLGCASDDRLDNTPWWMFW
jgi:hypothetical protein